jgi:signal transduction histidine kinase
MQAHDGAAANLVRMPPTQSPSASTESPTIADEQAEALATAVHDLLSPLSLIKAHAQLLRRLEPHLELDSSLELRRRLEGIDLASGHIVTELRRMLAILRPSENAGICVSPPPAMDLAALVRRVVSEQQSINAGHSIQLGAMPKELVGAWDADELARLLANLIGNAAKYSQPGSRVDVRVVCDVDADGRWAVLEVMDRGCGIPARDLPFIFEPFRRGSNVGQTAGSGLGLASAWRTAKLHGGLLSVESEEGIGTCASVRLPLAA